MTSFRLLWLAGTLFIALALYAQNERCTLVGKVVDAAGAPAAAADIRLQRSGFGERYVGTTDCAGKFEMRGLPSGDYNLVVSLNGLFNKIEDLHVASAKPVDLGVIWFLLPAMSRVSQFAMGPRPQKQLR